MRPRPEYPGCYECKHRGRKAEHPKPRTQHRTKAASWLVAFAFRGPRGTPPILASQIRSSHVSRLDFVLGARRSSPRNLTGTLEVLKSVAIQCRILLAPSCSTNGIAVPQSVKLLERLGEGAVEGDPVSISFRVDDHPVLVEREARDFRHSLCPSALTLCRRSRGFPSSRESPS